MVTFMEQSESNNRTATLLQFGKTDGGLVITMKLFCCLSAFASS